MATYKAIQTTGTLSRIVRKQLELFKVDESVFRKIKNLGLLSRRQTKRGCRAGLNKRPESIQVRVCSRAGNDRFTSSKTEFFPSFTSLHNSKQNGVNPGNLIQVTFGSEESENVKNAILGSALHIPVILNNRLLPNELPKHAEKRVGFLVKIPRISEFLLKRFLNFTVWNARSVDNKLPSVADSVMNNNTDCFIITETWFNARDDSIKSRLESTIQGFNIHQVPRSKRKGGGVAILNRKLK